VAAADTAVRNPIATQNNSSVRHHPAINEVAMTAVAHPADDADRSGGRRRQRVWADGPVLMKRLPSG